MCRPGHSFIKLFYSCAFQGVHGDFPSEAKTPVLYWFPLLPLSQGRIAGISVDGLQTVLTLPLLVHSFSCPLVSPLTFLSCLVPFLLLYLALGLTLLFSSSLSLLVLVAVIVEKLANHIVCSGFVVVILFLLIKVPQLNFPAGFWLSGI